MYSGAARLEYGRKQTTSSSHNVFAYPMGHLVVTIHITMSARHEDIHGLKSTSWIMKQLCIASKLDMKVLNLLGLLQNHSGRSVRYVRTCTGSLEVLSGASLVWCYCPVPSLVGSWRCLSKWVRLPKGLLGDLDMSTSRSLQYHLARLSSRIIMSPNTLMLRSQ
jgi:hypothetical protein